MSTSSQERRVHLGHNIKRLREILSIKQEAVAIDLGSDWDQKKVSRLEEKEVIDDELLEQIARIFKVPVDVIKNFDSEMMFSVISNTFNNTSHENSTLITSAVNYQPNFNVADKLMEVVEENGILAKKNAELYERVISQQAEMIQKLEKLLKEKQ